MEVLFLVNKQAATANVTGKITVTLFDEAAGHRGKFVCERAVGCDAINKRWLVVFESLSFRH